MATTRYLTYFIVLSDPKLVAQYQAQFPLGYQFAPFNPNDSVTHLPGGAAVAFSAPWAGSFPGTDPNHVASGTYFGPAPYTWSPEWTSANNYDCTVASFQRKTGGFWGMGGTTTTYYWLGQFVLDQAAQPTVGGVVVPPASVSRIPKRRYIEGFEVGTDFALGAIGASNRNISRDASRHVGGFGMAFRGASNSIFTFTENVYGAAANARTWQRFYIRLRQPDPNNTVRFWGANGSVSQSSGPQLGIAPDGRLSLYNADAAGVVTLLATSANPLARWTGASDMDAWHKIDVLLRFNPNETIGGPNVVNVTTGACFVYVDGVQVIAVTSSASAGLGQNQTHISTFLGGIQSLTNVLELDIDDFISAEWPTDPTPSEQPNFPSLNNPDWLQGTKIVLARWKSNGAGHSVNWAGDGRIMLQNPLGTPANATNLTSTTANAVAEALLDTDQIVDRDDRKTGVLSFVIHMIGTNAGPTNGTLGYLLNGGGAVMAAITQSAARAAHGAFKSIVDGTTTTFAAFTSLAARHAKSNDANAATVVCLSAQIELAGTWGLEDYRLTENGTAGTPTFPRFVGQHNAPYPNAVFAKGAPAGPPNSGVVIVSQTYVGNNTGQDITFRTPPHFIWIRSTSGTGGFRWWSSMMLPHRDNIDGGYSLLARVDEDTTFVPGLGIDLQQQRYRLRIAGGDTQINAVGVTYQLVAFCDPGARYCLAGTMSYPTAQAATEDHVLINPNFLAEAGLFFPESATNNTNASMLFKGLGTTVDAVMRATTSAQLAAALTFVLGKLTSQSNLHSLSSGVSHPYLLFRRHDGNNDPGEPGVVVLANWTGDGNASRSVGFAPSTGKRPIFAMVFASDTGGAFFRDVSHTSTNSMRDSTVNSTTGITGGGIDQISVGSSLNVNGVTYSALVFVGDATAGNGGFGINGEYIPVEAAPPADGPFPPSPTLDQLHPVAPVVPIVGEPDLDQITTLSDAATNIGGLVGGQKCEYYSRHVVNMALSRINVSKRIGDLANDLTEEAVLARSHVLEDTNQVLRDFDWPFATRYATLVLVGGTVTVPVNQDWQYSYRLPNACMKARRLTNQNLVGRAYDRNPPKFRIGGDDTGANLLYTNEPTTSAAPLVLEYTVRSICPALYGDALFRDALAWKFAFSLAPPLSKDSKKQEYCRQMYERAIALAKVPAAQEQQQARPGQADWISDRDFDGWANDSNPWNR